MQDKGRIFEEVTTLIEIVISIFLFGIIEIVKTYFYTSNIVVSLKNESIILILLIIPVWYLNFKIFQLSRSPRTRSFSRLLFEYFFVISFCVLILFVFITMLKLETVSRASLLIFWILDFIVLFSYKSLAFTLFKKIRASGKNIKHLIIIGDNGACELAERILETPSWGYKIKALYSNCIKLKEKYNDKLDFLEVNTDINDYLKNETVDEVIYCKEDFNQNEVKKLIYRCLELGIVFKMRSSLFNIMSKNTFVNYLDSQPYITFTNTPQRYIALKLKSVFDFVFSVFIVLVLSPVFIGISLAIKFSSKGPVFFVQERVGKNGRLFKVIKFRTMVTNAEEIRKNLEKYNEQDGPVFKMKDDPRVTNIGKFLRKTSLDELPQFFNVLRGEMSIVGPRPPIPKEVEDYESWQHRRLSMKPGITCIWQVSGRNNIPFEKWMKMDLQYIDTWSLKQDFILIGRTIGTIVKGSGQ